MRMRTEDEKTDGIKGEEKKQTKSKITPIRFPYKESDDPVIDAFILQGLQEEADATEERLNRDPELSQINPSEDQFDKIVARLKEMGVWEEEEEKQTEEEHEQEVEEARKEIAAANRRKDADGLDDLEHSRRVLPEMENSGEDAREDAGEDAPGEDELYQMLSEKDREAITLGRRALERKKKRSRYVRMIVKRGGIVAAAFVLLIGVSMNVSASRQWIVQMWGAVTEVFVSRTVTENIEESRAIESTVAESLAAMEEIEEITGIPGINFIYWPDGMEYLEYDVVDDSLETHIFYLYNEKIIDVYMKKADTDETNYYVFDGNAELIETIENWFGIEVELWQINQEQESERYLAEFAYEDYRYLIYGYLPLEEVTELVKNMNFLSEAL